MKKLLIFTFIISLFTVFYVRNKHKIGEEIDSLHGVAVYYNGSTSNVIGRNTTDDGYNLGQKYQCVEFVKRYYYEHFKHKMPNSYGNAVDFYNKNLSDGQLNSDRALVQFTNGSKSKPKVSDLIVMDGHLGNRFGHVAIISEVSEKEIEIIQQNPGINGKSRIHIDLIFEDGKWTIANNRVLGWLRLVQ